MPILTTYDTIIEIFGSKILVEIYKQIEDIKAAKQSINIKSLIILATPNPPK